MWQDFLAFGAFEMNANGGEIRARGVLIDNRWESMDEGKITEDVACSRFAEDPACIHAWGDRTQPTRRRPTVG